MSNPEIEHFKIWSSVYCMWAFSNFDRIVAETVKKYSIKVDSYDDIFATDGARLGSAIRVTNEKIKQWPKGTQWKIRLPLEILKDREPSIFHRVLATLTLLLKGRFP